MKNLRLFVFLLLFTSCAQFKGTRGPSSQVNDFIEYTDEGVFHYAEKSREIALDLAARYPSDKYIIMGWGINSSPVMNELREIHESIYDVPVTRLNEIYNEHYTLPSTYDYPKIEAQTKILYQKIFPSLAEIGNKEIVIFRSLWEGDTFGKFSQTITRFYKEQGLQTPIHFNLLADTEEKAEYNKSKMLDDNRFGHFELRKDYNINFFIDQKYHNLLRWEILDEFHSRRDISENERLIRSLELVSESKKKGVLHSYLNYIPESALRIIENDNFVGFELNKNRIPGPISYQTQKFKDEYRFVNKKSTIEDSFAFIRLVEEKKLPSILQTAVIMRHFENIFIENPNFDIWDSSLEKIPFDFDKKTFEYFFNKMKTNHFKNYIKLYFKIIGKDIDQLINSKTLIGSMIYREIIFDIKTHKRSKTVVVNNLINDLRYMYDDQFIIEHWEFFRKLYSVDDSQFYKALKKSYQNKNQKGFLKHFVFNSSAIHDYDWIQRLSIPELDDFLKKKSCMDYFKI